MTDVVESIILQTKRRSFFAKTGILFIGAVLVLVGNFLLDHSPYLGYSLVSIGLVIDWFIVYIVYREMDEMRHEIQKSRDEIQETKEEIIDIQMKVENTSQRIEGIATDMYDRQGSADRFGNLETKRANLREEIDQEDSSDPYQY